MESITVLLILSVVVVAVAFIACVATYKRRWRREVKPRAARETQPTPVQEKVPVAGETRPLSEKAQPKAVHPTEPTASPEPPPLTVPRELASKKQVPESPTSGEVSPAREEEAQLRRRGEEQPTTAAEGTRQPGIGEVKSTTLKNIKPSPVERSQPAEAEEPPLAKREAPVTGREKRKPIDRGGRPRGTTYRAGEALRKITVPHTPKPEIVCWKRERQWFVEVEVPEDQINNAKQFEVYQDNVLLLQDDFNETCWMLNSLSGHVRFAGGEISREINLGQEEDYLLFKLSGQDSNQGRLVKSASSGSYLVITPDNWERDEAVAGPPPIAPEPVVLDGYLAHFFVLERDTNIRIGFRTPEGVSISLSSTPTRFELIGERLEDSSENIGPLFREPPRIRAADPQEWKSIETIIVGEEGSGRGRWRMQFSPDPDSTVQDLTPEILDKRGGWYFLRLYNGNDDLVESLDFRFLVGLDQVKFPELSPFSSTGGHKPVRIEIVHDPEITLHPVEHLTDIQIERETGKTILTVPPDPKYDTTNWQVGYKDGPQVEMTLLVERIWWSLGEKEEKPTQWEDKPLALSRDDFAASSKKAIWLRFPKNRWVDRIFVGFKRAKRRSYPVKVAEKTLYIPLHEFADAEEVTGQVEDRQLRVWIERNGEFEAVVGILPAMQIGPPPQQWVGIGRYKTASANARLQRGSGRITVNGIAVREYFKDAPSKGRRFLRRLLSLPQVRDALLQLDVQVGVWGSSPTTMRQVKAVAHALARALTIYDHKLKLLLKQVGFGGVRVRNNLQKSRRGGR